MSESKIIKRFNRLKTTLDRLSKESDKAQGAIQQLEKDLEKEIGIKSLKKAKQILAGTIEKHDETKEEIERMLKELETKWADELEKQDAIQEDD